MMYKVVVMISCALFFNISAMKKYKIQRMLNEEIHILTLLDKLVCSDNKNSIIVFPIKTSALQDERARRKESEEILSDITINGLRMHLQVTNNETAGKAFLILDNKVDDHKKNPVSCRGLLCKKIDGEIIKQEVNYGSREADESSFIIFNMPYYKQGDGCFEWAYAHELFDFLGHREDPCLVFIDENIYNKVDPIDRIYKRFYGKKKNFKYDKFSHNLEEYKPSFLSEISFYEMVGWAALATVGLYYIMPSGPA